LHCIYKSSKRRPHLQVTKVLPQTFWSYLARFECSSRGKNKCGRLPWDTAAQIAPPCRNAPPRFLHSLGPLSPHLVCLALFLLLHNPGQHNTDYFATRESCESTAWILSGKIQYQDPAHSTRYGGTGVPAQPVYRYWVPVQLYLTISSAPMSREIRHRPTFYTKNQYKRKCLLMRTEILQQPRRHSWCATW
jgi:hypothetical protein